MVIDICVLKNFRGVLLKNKSNQNKEPLNNSHKYPSVSLPRTNTMTSSKNSDFTQSCKTPAGWQISDLSSKKNFSPSIIEKVRGKSLTIHANFLHLTKSAMIVGSICIGVNNRMLSCKYLYGSWMQS